jgi:branched-chain amino acid transport system permease protein
MNQVRQSKLLRYILIAIFSVAVLIWLPLSGSYAQSMLTEMLIYGIFAVGLNVIVGNCGMFSMGNAAYFGLAGYTTHIIVMKAGITSFWLAAPAGILMVIVASAIFGVVALRARGIYFMFITVAFGELMQASAVRFADLTEGTDGLVGIPYPDLGLPFKMDATGFYFFVLIVFFVCMFLLYRFIKSPFGLTLQGIRDDEQRMKHLGCNTWLHKYIAFIIAGIFSGVAGILYGSFGGVLTPPVCATANSAGVLLMIVLGSNSLIFGPVLGSAIVVVLQYYSSIWTPERWPLILGGAFIIAIMFLRGGVGIYLVKLWKRVKV